MRFVVYLKAIYRYLGAWYKISISREKSRDCWASIESSLVPVPAQKSKTPFELGITRGERKRERRRTSPLHLSIPITFQITSFFLSSVGRPRPTHLGDSCAVPISPDRSCCIEDLGRKNIPSERGKVKQRRKSFPISTGLGASSHE